jgi:hypothetical protein
MNEPEVITDSIEGFGMTEEQVAMREKVVVEVLDHVAL